MKRRKKKKKKRTSRRKSGMWYGSSEETKTLEMDRKWLQVHRAKPTLLNPMVLKRVEKQKSGGKGEGGKEKGKGNNE